MNVRKLVATLIMAATLAACDSGDITLAPTNIDNSNQGNTTANPTPVSSNPCAAYEDAGQRFEGNFDGTDCTYDTSFVSDTRPITVSTIRFPNFGGLHIFEDSLFIGEDVSENAANAGVRVPQEGEGTRLIIDAGNTMVFTAEDSYVRIARGSQIFAEGTAAEPIVFTADEDAVLGLGTENDRGLWGGIQINGNAPTNKCHDGTLSGNLGIVGSSQFEPSGVNPHSCHAIAEGRPATYGGANAAENSGVLTYVVVKHAGFEVVLDDELNAVTLNGVGSGTTISYVQTYTTQDDGFEMFGGAVNLDHIVAVNVGDDSIDWSEGYQGDIQYAVVIDTSGANNCLEGDNTGENRDDGITPRTRLRISNLTCITSGVDRNSGTNPSSKGDSEGLLFREGVWFELYNSIVTSNDATMQSNECFEVADSEGPESVNGAQGDDPDFAGIRSVASSNVVACGESLKLSAWSPDNDGFDLSIWLQGGNGTAAIPTNGNTNNVVENTNLPFASLIEGGVGTRGYLTLADIQDSTGGSVFDQTTQLTPVGANLGGIFTNPSYLGGASAGDDWLAGWTVGLGQPLIP